MRTPFLPTADYSLQIKKKSAEIFSLGAWKHAKIISALVGAYVFVKTAPSKLPRKIEAWFLRWFSHWSQRDPAHVRRVVRVGRGLGIWPAFFERADAVLTARTLGWAAASQRFVEITAEARRHLELSAPAVAALLAGPKRGVPARLVVPAVRHEAEVPPATAAQIVVYTARFGAPFTPEALFGLPRGVRCLCFTDQRITAPGWEIVHVEAEGASETFYKLCPHRVLPGVAAAAEMSLYVEPERLITGNVHTLLSRWLIPHDLVLWRHDECGDWHDLAQHHLLRTPARSAEVLEQARRAESEGLPRGLGAYDTSVLWRRHGDPRIATLMDAWWALHEAVPGPDDVHLYRLVHEGEGDAPRPAIMPEILGPARDNAFFTGKPVGHLSTRKRVPKRPSRPVPITFLYAERREDKLMTLLRGKQLSELVAARLGDGYEVAFVSDRHLDRIRDQIVILNMGFLAFASMGQLERLRRNNLALITDWQDGVVDHGKVALCDAQMAMSLRQASDLNRMFPDVPAFHVTHHVNTAIRPCSPPEDRLRTLYFGATFNTIIPASLQNSVDVIDGQRLNLRFDDFLPHYNCHWIVRRYVPIEDFWLVRGASPLRRPSLTMEQWKPFLKGFVAARCGAVVLVTREDADARHYLGDDYPFYAASLAPTDLEAAWVNTAAMFGGPEWRLAQGIMRQVEARSSDEQVCVEFKAMVDAVIT